MSTHGIALRKQHYALKRPGGYWMLQGSET